MVFVAYSTLFVVFPDNNTRRCLINSRVLIVGASELISMSKPNRGETRSKISIWAWEVIISLAFPCTSLKISPHLMFFFTFCRVWIFCDKFHQHINHLPSLCRIYVQEKRFIQVNSINKHLIRQLRLECLLNRPSPFTK